MTRATPKRGRHFRGRPHPFFIAPLPSSTGGACSPIAIV